MALQRIVPCLWFDSQAEEAAKLYVSVFPRSTLGRVIHYGDVGQEIHGRPPGSVMTVDFVLDGSPLTALNGGPLFQFSEAVSLQVMCETQAEIDHYWSKLGEGGDQKAQQCGWLKDRFGLSWQITPADMPSWMDDRDPAQAGRVMAAMLEMKKLDIAQLKKACQG